jgi:hypothetical protein
MDPSLEDSSDDEAPPIKKKKPRASSAITLEAVDSDDAVVHLVGDSRDKPRAEGTAADGGQAADEDPAAEVIEVADSPMDSRDNDVLVF